MIATPRAILDFWFKETPPERWFAVDPTLDAAIRERFAETWQAARDEKLSAWESSKDGAFALILVLDQFPRNMFRNSAEAFSTDKVAREVAGRAIARGFDLEAPLAIRHFFYLPFMHSEDMADQDRAVDFIKTRCGADHYSYPYALQHRDIVARFGRFPARNAALGRSSTLQEKTFLTGEKSS